MNFFNLKDEKKIFKNFLILGWLSCWFSLSYNPENIEFSIITSNPNLKEILNFLRGISQIIYFPIILFITIFLSLKNNFLKKKSNIILILLIFFHLIQLIGLIFSENENLNSYYFLSSINVILTTLLFKNFFSEKELTVLLNINIFFLLSIFIFFSTKYLINSIIDGQNLYVIWGNLSQISSYEVPKPTGLSRTALILLIFFNTIKFNNRSNFWISSLTGITTSFIILFFSRTINFIFILYLIFYIYYYQVYTRKNIIVFLRNFLLIPIIFIFIFNTSINISSNIKNNLNILEINLFESKVTRDFPEPKKRKIDSYSSGRVDDWTDIIKKNEKILIGNGVMGDRFLINQSASNILVYSYASSGLIGIILIGILSLLALILILNSLFSKKIKFKHPYLLTSCLILLCLMFRSILETSYGIFSIDLILFCSCIAIITKNKEINKDESI